MLFRAILLAFIFISACTSPPESQNTSASSTSTLSSNFQSAKLMPIGKAWAKTQINVPIFRSHGLLSNDSSQWVSYYDSSGHVVIAQRLLTEEQWEVSTTPFEGNLLDAHNSISIGLDGNDYLHMSWDHHNHPLKYVKSEAPASLNFGPQAKMSGQNERRVTYPEFIHLSNGDLLFIYREGGSGNGNTMLNRYRLDQKKWEIVQHGWLDGEGERNAYTNKLVVDNEGTWHLSWVWRETPDVASNHDMCYAKSEDEGKTWKRSDGSIYQLPITAKNAEYIYHIPQNSGLINQTSSTVDSRGYPIIATYWQVKEDSATQYMVIWYDGEAWQNSVVTNRQSSFKLGGTGTRNNPISRPLVLCDDEDRVYVIYNDEERGQRVSVAICENLSEGEWVTYDLTQMSVGNWEPVYDPLRWERDNILNLLVQKVGQGNGERTTDLPATMVYVLEWSPKSLP